MKKATGIFISILFIVQIASAQFGRKLPVVLDPKFEKDTLSIVKYGATGASNIAINGKGIIDDNGDVWRAVKKDKLTETQWNKLVASGGVMSDDQKTWHPSGHFMRASKMPANPGLRLLAIPGYTMNM